ncbi:hypothetical protein [Salinibius halmophilus]|uniref:hypothetical protein n=1 Tax=Salinibius halmophilus TaxID=1853216 RepID=UPI000E66E5FE|nr:hypothetical protein [Salinibius halmophilus]
MKRLTSSVLFAALAPFFLQACTEAPGTASIEYGPGGQVVNPIYVPLPNNNQQVVITQPSLAQVVGRVCAANEAPMPPYSYNTRNSAGQVLCGPIVLGFNAPNAPLELVVENQNNQVNFASGSSISTAKIGGHGNQIRLANSGFINRVEAHGGGNGYLSNRLIAEPPVSMNEVLVSGVNHVIDVRDTTPGNGIQTAVINRLTVNGENNTIFFGPGAQQPNSLTIAGSGNKMYFPCGWNLAGYNINYNNNQVQCQ